MRKLTVFLILFIAVLLQVMPVFTCLAWPSSDFYQEDDNIFDDWHVCRTSALGEDGFMQIKETETEVTFRPLITFESLGEYVDTAYRLGEQLAKKYPDRHQRAEKVFEYVRDGVQYLNDIDQFGMGEYAQNADEVANAIKKEGIAYGDCEEFAILLAVMYQGAGYRSAIVVCPSHAAALVHLPNYEKANAHFSLEGEPGWVWAEATGKRNPFGWCPVGEIEKPILKYEISSDEHIPLWQPPTKEEPPPEPEPKPTPEPPVPREEPPPEPEPKPTPEPPVPRGGPNLIAMALPFLIAVIVLNTVAVILLRRHRV